jgi:hypothetical protein
VLGTDAPQSAIAATADLTALLYAVESMSLRAGQVSTPTANAIVETFADYALGKAVDHARAALGSVGVAFEEARTYLEPLMSRKMVDTVGLKQLIAEIRAFHGYAII